MTRDELHKLLWGSFDTVSINLFKDYHRAHPEIYKGFVRYATSMRSTGRKKYSAKCIMERIRWDHDIQYTDKEFKISNSMTSFYVRMLIWNHESFFGFFQLKKVRGIRPKPKAVLDRDIVVDYGEVQQ